MNGNSVSIPSVDCQGREDLLASSSVKRQPVSVTLALSRLLHSAGVKKGRIDSELCDSIARFEKCTLYVGIISRISINVLPYQLTLRHPDV
jgi:hypothetical protein